MERFRSTEPMQLDKEQRDPSQELGDTEEKHSVAITLAIVLTAFIISPMTDCLGPVLELNVSHYTRLAALFIVRFHWIFFNFEQGLLAAIPLAYILPGLAYIQMEPHSLLSREKLPAVGLVAFGTIVTLSGAAVLLPSLGGDCKSNIDLGYCGGADLENSTATLMAAILRTTISPVPQKG